MKKSILITTTVFAYCLLQTAYCFSQGTAINDNGASADGSAMLDIVSTTKGLLIPRMTSAERNAVISPATSLLIFNTDVNCYQAYISSQWQNIFCDLGCTGAPAMPGTIYGNNTVCQNSNGNNFYVSQVAGATSYNWTVPTGATIVSGQGTTGITVNFGTTSGDVTVLAGNNCGISFVRTMAVTVEAPPAAAGAVSGTSTVCATQSGVAFSVGSITGATSYFWSYSGTGFAVAAGSGTASITADFSGATAGDLTVYGANACGNGTVSPAFSITINTVPPAPSATAATNIQATSFTANWNASPGATSYYLDVATDIAFTGILTNYNNLNVGNDTTFNVTGLSCATDYFYRVRASNSCGTSLSSDTVNLTTAACCCLVSGYPYYQDISVTNNTGLALTDYQLKLTITYNPHMKSDFSDLLFRDASCNALNFWIWQYTASSTATVFVKVSSIPVSGATIKMYYGNSGATSQSDAPNTMEFYEDFPADINSWSTNIWSGGSGTGSITWDAGRLKDYVEHCYSVEAFRQVGNYASAQGLMFEFDWTAQASGWYEDPGMKVLEGTVNTTTDPVSAPATPIDFWNGSPGCSGCFINGPNQTNNGHLAKDATLTGITTLLFRLYKSDDWCQMGDHYWTGFWADNVFVRKYNTPEPSGSYGSEQICN